MSEKKFVSVAEILERYKKGEKNFSNIVCKGANLGGVDLNGCNFSYSDLSFTDFSRSTLIGCDFSEANLEWSDLTFANLSKSNFYRANIAYSVFNDAIVDGANFTEANLEWSLAFNCRLHAANLKGAKIFTIAYNISDISENGMAHAEEMLRRLKGSIPFSVWLAIRYSIDKTKGTVQATQEVTRTVGTYGIKRGTDALSKPTKEYSPSEKGLYTETTTYGFETQYARGMRKREEGGYTR